MHIRLRIQYVLGSFGVVSGYRNVRRPQPVEDHGYRDSRILEYVILHYFRKTLRMLTLVILVVAWAVTFTLPYLYNPIGGAGLGEKILDLT